MPVRDVLENLVRSSQFKGIHRLNTNIVEVAFKDMIGERLHRRRFLGGGDTTNSGVCCDMSWQGV